MQSPAVDALAADGVILTRMYVYKFCSPTRGAFLTGRLPGHGVQLSNLGFTAAVGSNRALTMMPAKLQQAGYHSAAIGKWHQVCAFSLPPHCAAPHSAPRASTRTSTLRRGEGERLHPAPCA